MITKRNISDAILKLKGFNNDDRKIDPRTIWFVVDRARNYLFVKNYFINKNSGEANINADFITSKPSTTVKDTVRDQWYLTFPGKLISIPGNKGLRQIFPVRDPKTFVVINEPGSDAMYEGLEASSAGSMLQGNIEGDRLYFNDLPWWFQGVDMMVAMIESVEDLGEDDPIPIPGDLEAELIELTSRFLDEAKVTPEDRVNDNVN